MPNRREALKYLCLGVGAIAMPFTAIPFAPAKVDPPPTKPGETALQVELEYSIEQKGTVCRISLADQDIVLRDSTGQSVTIRIGDGALTWIEPNGEIQRVK